MAKKESKGPTKRIDRRAMESASAKIGQLLSGQNFASLEEANKFLMQQASGLNLQNVEYNPESPLEMAQEIMWEAFEQPTAKKRIALAEKALKTCGDCADAYVLMAEDKATTLDEQIDYFRKGREAGRRALGEEFFKNPDAPYWAALKTRPFMRASNGLAEALYVDEQVAEAVEIWKELLALNPSDNQGVRFRLTSALIELNRLDEAEAIVKQFNGDPSAPIAYSKALISFLKHGDRKTSQTALLEAAAQNRHVIEIICGVRECREPADSYTLGSVEEAEIYIAMSIAAWTKNKRAIEWVAEFIGSQMQKYKSSLATEGESPQWFEDLIDEETPLIPSSTVPVSYVRESNTLTDLNSIVAWLKDKASVEAAVLEKFEEILESDAKEKRIKLAKKILADDSSGLAHLMLAREHDGNPEMQRSYYEAGIDLIEGRLHSQNAEPTIAIYGLLTLELAWLLWRMDERERAIDVLESADVDGLGIGQDTIDEHRFTLTSFHICTNNDAEARQALDGEAVPTAEWYYMNALLKFREHGDGYISRGAFALARSKGADLAELLCCTEYDTEAYDRSDIEHFEMTREAWQSTPGAVEWLRACMERGALRVDQDEVVDELRLRRFENELDLATTYIKRGEIKAAKRSLMMALKEADRLNDGGASFLETLEVLADILEEHGDSPAPLVERLDARFSRLKGKESTSDIDRVIRSYADISSAYLNEAGVSEKAEQCGRKALDLLKNNEDAVNGFDEMNILTVLASAAKEQNNFKNMEDYTRALVDLREKISGSQQLRLIDDMQYLRYALHKVGKHDEERKIAERIFAIDVHADKDPDFEDFDWCSTEEAVVSAT